MQAANIFEEYIYLKNIFVRKSYATTRKQGANRPCRFITEICGRLKTTFSRTFTVSGRAVKIRATYQIFVDAKPYALEFNVGSDGKIFPHLLPYESFASLVDMVTAVIRSFPNSFGQAGGDDNA